ncbi:MAG: hypothetical protein KAT09_02845 [Candidatus Aegiribacteria sp.]|nr:hypothetical protein [Candidatus Aegiribacteria sp.]
MKYFVLLTFAVTAMAGSYLGDDNGTISPGEASLVVLDSFTPSLTVYLVGLGYDESGGEFWVANNQNSGTSAQNEIAVYAGTSPYGYIGSFNQNNTTGWGILDMAYRTGIMYVSDMNANVFNLYNTNTQTKIGSFNATTTGAYAVATNGYGTFYTGDFGSGGNIYSGNWDGVSGSSPSWSVFTTSPLPETGILGAAYDVSWPCLWVTVSSGTGSIYQIGMDGAQMAVYDQTAQGTNPAGADMAPFSTDDEKLWVLMQADPDVVYCYDSAVALDRATWGTIKSMF